MVSSLDCHTKGCVHFRYVSEVVSDTFVRVLKRFSTASFPSRDALNEDARVCAGEEGCVFQSRHLGAHLAHVLDEPR